MNGNREYKSDVFSMLMEDKKRALQLYNVMNGSSYDNPDDVEIKTLDGGISLTVRNDAAFVVDARLSIYEHQSTVCPNMPVRSLIYFTTILSDMLSGRGGEGRERKIGRNLYGRKLVKIPVPQFVVFYNGEEKQPEVQELKLSDAYEKATDDPRLELKCMVYNINNGRNEEIRHSCRWLDEYMIFVNKVRELHYGRTDEDLLVDIQMAIDYCIEHNILRDFLIKRRNEVTKSMKLDYTFDRQLELEREDAREEGFEEGLEEGREQGREQGLEQGREEGREEGREQGLEQGREEGRREERDIVNQLITLLLSDGRTEDLKKSASDREYQIQLLKEYGLM